MREISHQYILDELRGTQKDFPTIEAIKDKNGNEFEKLRIFTQHEDCVELSRVTTQQEYRRQGLAGMVTAFGLAHLMEEGFFSKGGIRLIGSCDPMQIGMYEGFGAVRLPELVDMSSVRFHSAVFYITADTLSEDFSAAIEAMRGQIRTNKGLAVVTPETQWLYRGKSPS